MDHDRDIAVSTGHSRRSFLKQLSWVTTAMAAIGRGYRPRDMRTSRPAGSIRCPGIGGLCAGADQYHRDRHDEL